MKKHLALLALIVFVQSCASFDQKTKTPPIHEDTVSTTSQEIGQEASIMEMTIEGMVCAMGCAAVIEKKLNKTAGIKKTVIEIKLKANKPIFSDIWIISVDQEKL